MSVLRHPAACDGPKFGAVHGGGGGGGSSADTTTNQTDDRIANDQGVVIDDGSTATFNIEDISGEALQELTAFGAAILNFAEVAQKESFRVAESSLDRAFDGTDGAGNDVVKDLIKYGAIAGGVYAAARFGPDLLKAMK